ncbi:hypothetical protein EVAR_31294_1 [Eumeta japonica]|uniref:Uncharacterized protein n=1 Tax=Eumeta variegata TaxID=151549 RepID=A0A4C1VSJ4_EUMVA|nr:hypothetical protein EVAR_31294_1 [Eumeta japonica]
MGTNKFPNTAVGRRSNHLAARAARPRRWAELTYFPLSSPRPARASPISNGPTRMYNRRAKAIRLRECASAGDRPEEKLAGIFFRVSRVSLD